MLGFFVFLAFALPHLFWIVPVVRKNKWVGGLIAALAIDLVLTICLIAMNIWTEALWFDHLGFASRYWTELTTKWMLFFIGAIISFLVMWINVYIVRALIPKDFWDGNQDQRIGYHILFGAVIVIALIFGIVLSGSWDTYLKYSEGVQFGTTDPVFNEDIGFFLFSLPWLRVLRNALLLLFALTGIAVGAFYWWSQILPYRKRSHRWDAVSPGDPKKRKQGYLRLLTHLSVIAIFWSAIWIFVVKISKWNLVFSERGAVIGAGYTDIHVLMGAYNVLIFIFIIAMAAFLVAAIVRGLKQKLWVFGGISAVWFLVWIIGVVIWPAIYQHYSVSPNELAKEKPYIERNIEFTQQAYDLEKVEMVDFPVQEEITSEMVEANKSTLASIRLWDWRVVQANNNQRQTFRLYYHYPDVDVVRYSIDGKIVQMMSSARELYVSRLVEQAKTWQNERLVYTHGYGMCMNPVNAVTQDGQPDYWVKDIPPVSRVPELNVSQPEIYYGEAANHIFVGTTHKEFDYPHGDTNATCYYQGIGGVKLGSGLRKLAFALRFDGLRLLTAGEFDGNSRIMFRRSLQERVQRLVPFLAFDDDPYQVIADGRIWFIWDVYTYTDQYPYSERLATTDYGAINYIRNSVKVVMDAYNGTVWLYVYEPDDPIIRTWFKIFPELFEGKETMPDYLRAHVRYPEDLMRVQAVLYNVYHMENPTVFYNREDAWDIAKETYRGNSQDVLPYYVVLTLPGEESEEFVQIIPFTPRTTDPENPKHNMLAWMAARCDGDHYGELKVYRFPKEKLILGPMQIEIRINQDEQISKDFSLWDQRGSQVIQANLITIPLSGYSLMYVEPIYLQADVGKMPELKRVVVASNTGLGYGPTFEAALEDLIGRRQRVITPFAEEEQAVSPEQLVKLAGEYFRNYQQLTGQGKIAEAGEQLEALGAILERLLRE